MIARRFGALLVSSALVATLVVTVRGPASAAALCGTPARDGSPTISGVVNTYFPGSANASAGGTSITVGAHAAGDASVATIANDAASAPSRRAINACPSRRGGSPRW